MIRIVAVAGIALAAGLAASPASAEPPARLSLAQAVALASGRNPNVAVAQFKADEAQAKIGQSRAALLPTVTGQATMTERTYNLYTLGLSLPSIPGTAPYAKLQGPIYDSEARLKVTQPLFDFAGWKRMRASQLGALGARADLGVTAEAASQGAAIAYLRAARADAVVNAREQDLELAKALQSLAEAQLAAGTSPAIDVTRARTEVATAQGALLIARNQRDRSRVDLARALGVDPAAAPEPADTLASTLGASDAPVEQGAAVTFAVEHRDELRGEQARLARARADRTATLGERLPRLDASADWGNSGVHYGDAIGTYTYALALTVPLIDGFRREGRLAEQAAIVRESETREKDLHDQIESEVMNAMLDLASGVEQQGVAAERLKLALDEVSQATERFTNGVAGNIEVINAQAALQRARDADIDARFAVASARVALARAAGVARTLH